MNIQTSKQIVCIDSVFRDNFFTSKSSDFTINLPCELNNVTKLKLISLELPNTFYLINDENKNNEFTIHLKSQMQSQKITFIIPPGAWYSNDMETFINQFLDNPPNNTYLTKYLMFKINENTGKTIFRFKTPTEYANSGFLNFSKETLASLQYKIVYPTSVMADSRYADIADCETCSSHEPTFLSNSALYIFGFRSITELKPIIRYSNHGPSGPYSEHLNDTLTNYFANGYLESSGIYGITRMNTLYVAVNDYVTNVKNHFMVATSENLFNHANVLGRIQVKNAVFTSVMDNGSDNIFKERNYYGNVNIKKLHIQLIDRHGKVVNTNGSEVSMALEFSQSQ